MPPAGNWLCFSCSIPPLFVLSHSLPMINTTGKLALFCTFLSPPASSLRIHWPQFSRHSPLATRHSPLATRHSPLPSSYDPPPLATACHRPPDFERPNGTRSRRAAPLFHYVTDPGNFFGQINPFLPARRRPTVDHSLVAGGAQRHFPCLRATMPPSLETMRGNWKNQFSNLSSLDTSCRSPLILVMRSSGTGVFPPSSIRT